MASQTPPEGPGEAAIPTFAPLPTRLARRAEHAPPSRGGSKPPTTIHRDRRSHRRGAAIPGLDPHAVRHAADPAASAPARPSHARRMRGVIRDANRDDGVPVTGRGRPPDRPSSTAGRGTASAPRPAARTTPPSPHQRPLRLRHADHRPGLDPPIDGAGPVRSRIARACARRLWSIDSPRTHIDCWSAWKPLAFSLPMESRRHIAFGARRRCSIAPTRAHERTAARPRGCAIGVAALPDAVGRSHESACRLRLETSAAGPSGDANKATSTPDRTRPSRRWQGARAAAPLPPPRAARDVTGRPAGRDRGEAKRPVAGRSFRRMHAGSRAYAPARARPRLVTPRRRRPLDTAVHRARCFHPFRRAAARGHRSADAPTRCAVIAVGITSSSARPRLVLDVHPGGTMSNLDARSAVRAPVRSATTSFAGRVRPEARCA